MDTIWPTVAGRRQPARRSTLQSRSESALCNVGARCFAGVACCYAWPRQPGANFPQEISTPPQLTSNRSYFHPINPRRKIRKEFHTTLPSPSNPTKTHHLQPRPQTPNPPIQPPQPTAPSPSPAHATISSSPPLSSPADLQPRPRLGLVADDTSGEEGGRVDSRLELRQHKRIRREGRERRIASTTADGCLRCRGGVV